MSYMVSYRQNVGPPPRPARPIHPVDEWVVGNRDRPREAPFAYEKFRLKEFERDRDGTWVDEIPDGNGHSLDAVRYAMMDDVLRGA